MQNKPNNWVTGFKRSPKSADTQVRAMGLFMNSLGYFEAIDTSYQKIHAEQGLYIDGDNKIFFRDFDNKDIYINSPSDNILSINASNGVAINTNDMLGYTGLTVNGTVNTGALTVSGNIIGTDITATDDITANDTLTVSGDSTLNQINQSGDRVLNSATVNDSIGGHQASYSFDGSDDYVSNGSFPAVRQGLMPWRLLALITLLSFGLSRTLPIRQSSIWLFWVGRGQMWILS